LVLQVLQGRHRSEPDIGWHFGPIGGRRRRAPLWPTLIRSGNVALVVAPFEKGQGRLGINGGGHRGRSP
ncbi:MAG TPA: hypothetical protein VH229_07080, partial [Candidatus Udaeobacter sp.]|nr:hypothetical protein [Candidatus Udaeobacter sp.]